MLLVPETDNIFVRNFAMVFSVILDVVSCVSILVANSSVANGAMLRNYFDRVVLGFDASEYSARRISELVQKVLLNRRNECNLQILHSSRDDPPGVRDWYEFSRKYPDSEVVFECQRQNQWWTERMAFPRVIIRILLFLTAIIIGVVIACILRIELLRILACFAGLVVVFLERLVNNVRYLVLLVKAKGCFEILENSRSDGQIEEMQKKIEERRELPVLESNFLHKMKSRILSERYEKTFGRDKC